jgi:hypothetical protein
LLNVDALFSRSREREFDPVGNDYAVRETEERRRRRRTKRRKRRKRRRRRKRQRCKKSLSTINRPIKFSELSLLKANM